MAGSLKLSELTKPQFKLELWDEGQTIDIDPFEFGMSLEGVDLNSGSASVYDRIRVACKLPTSADAKEKKERTLEPHECLAVCSAVMDFLETIDTVKKMNGTLPK